MSLNKGAGWMKAETEGRIANIRIAQKEDLQQVIHILNEVTLDSQPNFERIWE